MNLERNHVYRLTNDKNSFDLFFSPDFTFKKFFKRLNVGILMYQHECFNDPRKKNKVLCKWLMGFIVPKHKKNKS